MKIKQFISGRWPGLKALALCAMAATAFVACKDDETDVVRDPHITLSEDAFLYNAAGETHSFTVYSNIDWKVEMADTSQTWVNIWPKEGSDDGVFAVKVSKQPSKDPVLREARFRVVGKHEHDNIIQEITISQRDVDPALKLGVTTTPPKVVINSNGEEKYSVGVTCNVEWTARSATPARAGSRSTRSATTKSSSPYPNMRERCPARDVSNSTPPPSV